MSRRILVVDDEPDICWALESALSNAYDVVATSSGKEAAMLLATGDYRLAFVDAKLGDMDGLKLARMVSDLGLETTVVLVSGYVSDDDDAVRVALESGLLKAFSAKPFSLEEVRDLAAEVLPVCRSHGAE
jgi:DNA-binding NtrC family response regulator